MTYADTALAGERIQKAPPVRPLVPGPLTQLLTVIFAVLTPIVTAIDGAFPGRPVLAVLYLFAVPGVPLAALMRLPSRLATLTLAVAISIAVQLLLGQAALIAGILSPVGAQTAPSLISLVAFALASVRLRLFDQFDVLGIVRHRWVRISGALTEGRTTAAGLFVALILWVVAVHSIDPTEMNHFGLISVVTKSTIPVALAVLCIVTVAELRRPQSRPGWLAGVTVGFVVILQGTPVAIESAASLPTAWVHVGFAEYIREHGAVLHGFDARFSWPGFFVLLANLTTSAGLSDGGEFLRWAPLVQDLMILLPVVLLARRLSSSTRLVWLSAILYTAGNWFQQDYLSPQGLTLFLGMTVFALIIWSADPAPKRQRLGRGAKGVTRLLTYLRPNRDPALPIPGLSRTGYISLSGALILIILAIVVSHQLTPAAIVILLAWATYLRWNRFPGLWIVAAFMAVVWVSYGATDYWSGHIHEMFGGVGSLGSSLNSGVSARIAGNSDHQLMLYLRIALSGAYLLIALIGLYLTRRSGKAVMLAGLCFTPFCIIALQSYGGEVVIRAFVFAFPGLAIASAEALSVFMNRGRQLAVLLWSLLLVLGIALTATRGANAPFERITTTQLAAADTLNSLAKPGSTIGTFNSFNPLGRLQPGRYFSKSITPRCSGTGAALQCTIKTEPKYVFVSSSQEAYGELVENRAPGWTDLIVQQLVAAHKYSISYRTVDAVVLQRVDAKA